METASIKIAIHRTPEGKHTCAINLDKAEVCPFYQDERDVDGLVIAERCSWTRTKLERDADGTGYLIPVPCGGCPITAALNTKD